MTYRITYRINYRITHRGPLDRSILYALYRRAKGSPRKVMSGEACFIRLFRLVHTHSMFLYFGDFLLSTCVVLVQPRRTQVGGVEFRGWAHAPFQQGKRVLETGDAALRRSQPRRSRRSSLRTDRCIERHSGVLSHSFPAPALVTSQPSLSAGARLVTEMTARKGPLTASDCEVRTGYEARPDGMQ